MALDDPIEVLSRQRIISASAQLEVQLGQRDGGAPAILILRRLRDRAAVSLAALVTCNVYDQKGRIEIVTLQNEVKRYDEWVAWMRAIIEEGRGLDAEMEDAEREELHHLLVGSRNPDGLREAIALGLVDDKRTGDADQFD